MRFTALVLLCAACSPSPSPSSSSYSSPSSIPAPAAVATDAGTSSAPLDATTTLTPESPDPHPDAGTVTIKLIVDQKKQARVFWGRKDLGLAPLELVRPRSSGPLDLVIVAPGYLPLHTRVFTDRDDRLALRLFSEAEAPSLLGYDRRP